MTDQDKFTTDVASILVQEAAGEPSEGQQEVAEGDSPSEPVEASEEVLPDFDALTPEIPSELKEELAKDMIEDDDPPYVEATPEPVETHDDWYGDDETARLQKELAAAKKKQQHYEELYVKSGREKWAADAEKQFPLSKPFLDDIQAKSKREFMRQALAAHERIAPTIKEMSGAFQAALEQEKAKLREEMRGEATEAWGRPTVTPTQQETGEPAPNRQMQYKARKNKSFVDTIKDRLG